MKKWNGIFAGWSETNEGKSTADYDEYSSTKTPYAEPTEMAIGIARARLWGI